ncbi:MAG: hypothetical protein ACWGQW_03660 [bacterium]
MADDNSPQLAPDYGTHRKSVVSNDSLPEQNIKHGINMGGYGKAHIQVIPGATSNPTAQVLVWSDEKGAFISLAPAVSQAGMGAGTPYEFTMDCMGRIIFVALTTGVNDECKVFVSGYDMQHTP